MGIGSSLNVVRAGLEWRTYGRIGAGEILLEAISGDDEQERMLAGMALVKAGKRSVDLIEKAVAAGTATPPVVQLLADIDGPRCRALLSKIAAQPGDLGEAATQSIDLLGRIEALAEEE